MSETCVKLIARMILSTMVGEQKRTWELYEQYKRETRLHVPVKEYLEWRKERTA